MAGSGTPGTVTLRALLLGVTLLVWACTNQKPPAQRSLGDVESLLAAATPDAEKYVPDRLPGVRAAVAQLRAEFARRDYAAVLKDAPAALAATQDIAAAAAARKRASEQALDGQWTAFAGSVPEQARAVADRIDALGKRAPRGAAAAQLEAARRALAQAAALWSKAQAAFAAGNLQEAVSTAGRAAEQLGSAAGGLHMPLPGAAPGPG